MLCAMLSIVLYAEDVEVNPSIDNIPCVNYESNVLLVPGNDDLLMKLYDRIDRVKYLGEGQISILHIGGSHVQAGVFSHRLRTNFRGLIGDNTASKGVLFPLSTSSSSYEMWTTGQWESAKCVSRSASLPLGVKGIAIQSTDPNASVYFNLKTTAEDRWEYDELVVLGCDDNDVTPLLVCGRDTLYPSIEEKRSYIFNMPAMASDGQVLFTGVDENNPVDFRGIIPKNSQSGLVYHEAGINGASVPAWLRCNLFKEELAHINPDIVIMGIGINDANVPPSKFDVGYFKRNYRELINRIKAVNPNAVFIFITNNDCKLRIKKSGQYNSNTPKVEQAFIDLAREYNGAVWNQFRVMGGPESSITWVEQGLMKTDRIHFTREGYEILGDLFFNAFVQDFQNLVTR